MSSTRQCDNNVHDDESAVRFARVVHEHGSVGVLSPIHVVGILLHQITMIRQAMNKRYKMPKYITALVRPTETSHISAYVFLNLMLAVHPPESSLCVVLHGALTCRELASMPSRIQHA